MIIKVTFIVLKTFISDTVLTYMYLLELIKNRQKLFRIEFKKMIFYSYYKITKTISADAEK